MTEPQTHEQNNLHCLYCHQRGGKTMRFYLRILYKNGNQWEHHFPCRESLQEFLAPLKPFLKEWNYGALEEK